MDKFEIGDEVIINRDVAGMKRGEVAKVVDRMPIHDMYVIRLRDNTSTYNVEGRYNMLPEDLDHYVPELGIDQLRAAVDAAYTLADGFKQYSENIRYNNKDVKRPEWEERAKAYETAHRELKGVLDRAMRRR
jgi:hypothetical protein